MGLSWALNDLGHLPTRWGLHPESCPHTIGIFFNKPHPSILLHIKDATTQKVLILLFKKPNVTSSSAMHSYKHQEEDKSCIHAFRLTSSWLSTR
jgi:hypothetical protein